MQASKTENIEAEQQVLGAILINPSCKGRVDEILTPEDFSTQNHKIIFTAMANCQAIDVINVCEAIQAMGINPDLGVVLDLQQSVPSSANVVSYARIVKNRSIVRSLVGKAENICKMVDESTDETPSDLISAAQSEILSLTSSDDSSGPETALECVKRAALEWQRRMELDGKIDGLSSGFAGIDERVGGFKKGDLITIAARPAMGKTAFAMQIAASVAVDQQKNIAVFSLEMTTEQLIDRMMACVGRIPYSILKNPTTETWGEYSAGVKIASDQIKNSGLHIDDTAGLHINQICSRARRLNSMYGIDLVIVDHIGLVASEGQSREREVANITWRLKMLAKELECPVIQLSQLNRGVEQRPDRRPLMSDLRDSGSIEQDSDAVLLLYREDYYKEKPLNPNTLEVIASKLRAGEAGSTFLDENLAKMRFMDKPRDWAPNEVDLTDFKNKRGGFQG